MNSDRIREHTDVEVINTIAALGAKGRDGRTHQEEQRYKLFQAEGQRRGIYVYVK